MEFLLRKWGGLALILTFVLSGCGGSSGSSSVETEPDSPDLSEGVFLDSAVEGLQFRLGDELRLTDEDGTFQYPEGERVQFFIGDIELGSAVGAAILTPLDLVPGAVDETDPVVINLIRFLQTLDDDGDPANGITIASAVRDLSQGRTVNFSQNIDQFEAAVQALVNELTAATSSGARNLVSREAAVAHFRGTLASIDEGDTSGPTPDGEVLTPEEVVEFFYSRGPGVWRNETRSEYTYQSSFTFPAIGENPEVVITSDESFFAFNRVAIRSSGSGREVDYCSAAGLNPDNDLNTDEPAFGSDVCAAERVEYVRLGDATFGIRGYCEDELWLESTFEKLSSSSQYNQGSLTLNSPEIPNVNTQTGVCGSIINARTTTSNVDPEPNPANIESGTERFWTIRVVAPYEGQRLALNISFLNGAQQTGEFPVAGAGAADTPQAVVSLDSPAFDASLAKPVITDGKVTVSGVSNRNATGSYDLITSTGNSLSGTFEVDLN